MHEIVEQMIVALSEREEFNEDVITSITDLAATSGLTSPEQVIEALKGKRG